MTEKKILFKNKNGLHARPSAQVVAITTAYPKCRCFLIYEGNKINAKSILNLIINAIPAGSYLTIQADGEGEVEVVESLSAYLEQETLITEN